MNARTALRTGTASHHERVDRLFGSLDLGRHEDYRRFLAAQASPFLTIEAELERSAVSNIVADWATRRRSDLLKADLEDLGITAPALAQAPRLENPSAQLGALYVLEGSRLGGAVLKRDLPPDAPRRFIAAPQPKGSWQKLLEMLDKQLYSDQQRNIAIASARAVFELFEAAARQDLETAPA